MTNVFEIFEIEVEESVNMSFGIKDSLILKLV